MFTLHNFDWYGFTSTQCFFALLFLLRFYLSFTLLSLLSRGTARLILEWKERVTKNRARSSGMIFNLGDVAGFCSIFITAPTNHLHELGLMSFFWCPLSDANTGNNTDITIDQTTNAQRLLLAQNSTASRISNGLRELTIQTRIKRVTTQQNRNNISLT